MVYTRWKLDALGRLKPVVQWQGNLTVFPGMTPIFTSPGEKKPPQRERRTKRRADVLEFRRNVR